MVRPLEHWNLLWQRKLRHAERNKLHEHPQITGAVARQILRGHSLCQKRHNAPLAITERLYRALRWTKRAQIAGFDSQAGEIFGTVFLEGRNRPTGGVIVNIRSLTEGPFVSVLTDWSGRFQVRGLNSGVYEIVVEEAGYEPIRETVQLLRGPSPPLELYLKAAGNSSPVRRTDYAVSVRELRIPVKAHNAFEKGLERLAKNDPVNRMPHELSKKPSI